MVSGESVPAMEIIRMFGHSDCSIPEVYRRNLVIKSINADRNADTVITLNMNQNDYHTEYSNGVWKNQGAGLFVDFHFTDGCKVNHLKISGNIKLGLFDDKGYVNVCEKKETNRIVHIGVGGFAARTANSAGTVSFDGLHLEGHKRVWWDYDGWSHWLYRWI